MKLKDKKKLEALQMGLTVGGLALSLVGTVVGNALQKLQIEEAVIKHKK